MIEKTLKIKKYNSGNTEFDEKGFIIIKNFYDPKELYQEIPSYMGRIGYHNDSYDLITSYPEDENVPGAISRSGYPFFTKYHKEIFKEKIENILLKKIYPTYFFERYYFPGLELTKHKDRNSCEVSISYNISTNLKYKWPIFIESLTGKDEKIELSPGDAVIYRGCEVTHWRNIMHKEYEKTWYFKKKEIKGLYYHQIFMHYVFSDGYRCHFAGDKFNT